MNVLVGLQEGAITINFGRMLTRWTDDRVRATLHRVRTPKPGEYQVKT